MANETSLTIISNLLKNVYLKGLHEQFYSDILTKYVEKSKDQIRGQTIIASITTERSAGLGARADGGAVPTPRPRKYGTVNFALAYHYKYISITDPTIELARGDAATFIDAIDSEIGGGMEDFVEDLCVSRLGDGTGMRAIGITTDVTFAGTSDTVAVDSAAWLHVGMLVDLINGSTAEVINNEIWLISAISGTTVTLVTLSGAAFQSEFMDVSRNDYFVREGSQGQYMQGLDGLFGADATAYFGRAADDSGYGLWAATTVDNSNDAPSFETFKVAMDASRQRGGKFDKTSDWIFLTSYDGETAYLKNIWPDIRYTGGQSDPNKPGAGATFNGVQIVPYNRYRTTGVTAGRYDLLCLKKLRNWQTADPGWMDIGSPKHPYLQWTPNPIGWRACAKYYGQFGTLWRRQHVRINNCDFTVSAT